MSALNFIKLAISSLNTAGIVTFIYLKTYFLWHLFKIHEMMRICVIFHNKAKQLELFCLYVNSNISSFKMILEDMDKEYMLRSLSSVFRFVFPQHEGKTLRIYEWTTCFTIFLVCCHLLWYLLNSSTTMHRITFINSTISKSTSPAN